MASTDNQTMPYFRLAALLTGLLTLQGCSPTLNWRDVRLDQTPLVSLFPCKPERGVREITLGAQRMTLTMLACDAGDAKFALAYADTRDAANTTLVLDEWKSSTLANVRAQSPREVPFLLKGANVSPQPVAIQADGVRADGTRVAVNAVWFAKGSLVYQAAVYANDARPEVAETYFAGLRLP